jgi:iduronate 2-sulfatase
MKVWFSILLGALCLVTGASARSAERPNVLFIAIDDLRCDLGALGVPYAKTPHLDDFAKSARVFTHHYVQVPTCGASRCALWRGRYPTVPAHLGNDAIRATQKEWGSRSLPALFRAAGYRTLALGKLTHYPGGLTGKDWATGPEELPSAWDRAWIPDGPWKTPVAIMHGYAGGVPRQPGKSPPYEAHDGPDDSYPDHWVASEAIKTLGELAGRQEPWFFGVGFFKPHLPFAAPKRWHDLHATGIPVLKPEVAAKPSWPSGWHGSGEFRGNYGHAGRDPEKDPEYAQTLRRAYAASVSYMDAQVGRVLEELHRLGLEKNTIVVVWGDHGFLLGEHAIWGKHCLFEHALRAPLMIRTPDLPQPGKACDAIVETVDLYPTLAGLCQLSAPNDLDGRSLQDALQDPATPTAKPARGYWSGGGQRTLRTDRWRIIARPAKAGAEPVVELFDYATDPDAADHPDVVSEFLSKLKLPPPPEQPKAG